MMVVVVVMVSSIVGGCLPCSWLLVRVVASTIAVGVCKQPLQQCVQGNSSWTN